MGRGRGQTGKGHGKDGAGQRGRAGDGAGQGVRADQLGAVDADDVVEGDAGVRLHLHLGARPRQVHGAEHAAAGAATAAALTLSAAEKKGGGTAQYELSEGI